VRISWLLGQSTTGSALLLRDISAHSDVAEELTRAGATVSGVRSYCPDPARYAFVVLHLHGFTIIGLAFGLSGLAFRLPEERVEEAIRDGGAVAVELGPTWVRFEPWSNRETLAQSRERLARWCAVAVDADAVNRLKQPSDSCALDVQPVVKRGWVRWRSADQGPWVWYHTRGC
jgi:hypothetical protein